MSHLNDLAASITSRFSTADIVKMMKNAQHELSNNCLTTAVCNCLLKGVTESSISPNFQKYRSEAHPVETAEWEIKKRVCDSFANWKVEQSASFWEPIIYSWLVTRKIFARDVDNFGGLVFVDQSMTRFLLVNYYHDDAPRVRCEVLNQRRAKEVVALLMYLGAPQPKWVRSTYVLGHDMQTTLSRLHPEFLLPLSVLDGLPSSLPALSLSDPETVSIVHVPGQLTTGGGIKSSCIAPVEETLLEGFEGLPQIGGGLEGRKERMPLVVVRNGTSCEECNMQSPTLSQCSKCKISRYCSPKCQTYAWKNHKAVCKTLAKYDNADAA